MRKSDASMMLIWHARVATSGDGGGRISNNGGLGDHLAPPDRSETASNPQHPSPPLLTPLPATCSAQRDTRADSAAEHMPPRRDSRRHLQSARLERVLSGCKSASVWGERVRRRAVACTGKRKSGVLRHEKVVARAASSLSLPAVPLAAGARLLPAHGVMSIFARAQACRVT